MDKPISWITILFIINHFNFCNNDQKVVCDNDLTNRKLFDALKGIPNNKSLGNNRIIKQFYETFWDGLKDFYKFNKVSLLKKNH